MKQFVIPELGENIQSATIVKVLIKPGDVVQQDQSVLELETDKATIEVPSDVSGKVVEVKVNEGDQVEIGQLVFTVDADGAAATAPEEKKEAQPAPVVETSAPAEIPAPAEAPVTAPVIEEQVAAPAPVVPVVNTPAAGPKVIPVEN